MPVTVIRGVRYPTSAEAARRLGVDVRTVYKHLELGTPDMIGLNHKTMPKPCVIDGVSYPSITAAAKAVGRSIEAIRQRVCRAERKARNDQHL